MGHSLLLLWGPEARAICAWVQLGGLGIRALPPGFSLIGFMLRQFRDARWWGIRPYNANCLLRPRSRCFVSVS